MFPGAALNGNLTLLKTKSTFDYLSRMNLSVVQNLGRYVNVQGGYTRWQMDGLHKYAL
jgi:hypothetical protein